MLKLCIFTKVKVFFLVLVYVFNIDLFFGRHFGEGSNQKYSWEMFSLVFRKHNLSLYSFDSVSITDLFKCIFSRSSS